MKAVAAIHEDYPLEAPQPLLPHDAGHESHTRIPTTDNDH